MQDFYDKKDRLGLYSEFIYGTVHFSYLMLIQTPSAIQKDPLCKNNKGLMDMFHFHVTINLPAFMLLFG